MGNAGIRDVSSSACKRAGQIPVSGRYHRRTKKLQDDYELGKEVIGTGYNGPVFLATGKQDGRRYAVKGFKLHSLCRELREDVAREVEIFLCMDHPHVTRLVDAYEADRELMFVMEYMAGGELGQRIREQRKFSEKDAADAVWQMLLAVNYIHSHGVVHRDIKLENWLYESETSNHLKLIDFGFSKLWDPNVKMALSCGTLAYVAPEVLEGPYTSKCDLWSLGVIMWVLLCGSMPFTGSCETHLMRAVANGRPIMKRDWSHVSPEAKEFVMNLLQKDPCLRLSAEEAINNPWLEKRHAPEAARVDRETVTALCNFAHASSFRRAVMNMMAWSLSNKECEEVREMFLAMDTNKHGTISLYEFQELLTSKFDFNLEQCNHLFKQLDCNHNEEIFYTEFLAAMMSSKIAIHDDLLHKTFNRFDTDNSGTITKRNLQQILGKTCSAQEIQAVLAEVPHSAKDAISYEDFVRYLRGRKASEVHTELAGRIIDAELQTPAWQKTVSASSGSHAAGRRLSVKGVSSTQSMKVLKPPPMAEKSVACCTLFGWDFCTVAAK